MSELIIYLAPFAGGLIAWFIVTHITDVKDQITEVKGHVGKVENEVHQLNISIVKIQSDIDYIKDDGKIKSNLTVIKDNRKH